MGTYELIEFVCMILITAACWIEVYMAWRDSRANKKPKRKRKGKLRAKVDK